MNYTVLIPGWGDAPLAEGKRRAGRARWARGEAGAGHGLPRPPPRASRPGCRLSLGTFLSELTINRWREAIFFGISAISFLRWRQINMQMVRCSA